MTGGWAYETMSMSSWWLRVVLKLIPYPTWVTRYCTEHVWLGWNSFTSSTYLHNVNVFFSWSLAKLRALQPIWIEFKWTRDPIKISVWLGEQGEWASVCFRSFGRVVWWNVCYWGVGQPYNWTCLFLFLWEHQCFSVSFQLAKCSEVWIPSH